MAGSGGVGVLLGGVLTGSLDWRSIFLVNLPIGRSLPGAAAAAGGGRTASRHLDVARCHHTSLLPPPSMRW
jgi:MFS family permease